MVHFIVKTQQSLETGDEVYISMDTSMQLKINVKLFTKGTIPNLETWK